MEAPPFLLVVVAVNRFPDRRVFFVIQLNRSWYCVRVNGNAIFLIGGDFCDTSESIVALRSGD